MEALTFFRNTGHFLYDEENNSWEGLKALSKRILDIDIQEGEHDSVLISQFI
jgi:hypothetical protein